MAELNTVARPYTKAVFEYAREAGALDQWSEMLATAAAVVSNETVDNVLSNPGLTHGQKAEAVISVIADLDEQGKNLVQLLSENDRLSLLPEVSAQFEQLKADLQKTVEVEVTSAYELDEQQQQKLTQALSTKLGQDVSLTTEIDKSIIGGVIIRTDDLVIDGSLRGRLAKLAEAMNA